MNGSFFLNHRHAVGMMEWEQIGTLARFRGPRWLPGAPVAAFDFDSTLHPYYGRGPPMGLGVALVLALGRGGRNVVVITNRSVTKKRRTTDLEDFWDLVSQAGGSCDIYVATARDRYRKPQTGVWEKLCEDRGVVAGPADFFCGDAAGRPDDFSASDRNFARNVGLRFYTPEDLLGPVCVTRRPTPARLTAAEEIERELAAAADPARLEAWVQTVNEAAQYTAVMLMGSPASGKSTIARELVRRGYRLVTQENQDQAKALRQLSALLQQGHRVVIDNTHRDEAARLRYLGRARGVPAALVWVRTPQIVCQHLDGLRCDQDPNGRLLPAAVFPIYAAAERPPRLAEGFAAIFELEFALDPARPAAAEKRYAP